MDLRILFRHSLFVAVFAAPLAFGFSPAVAQAPAKKAAPAAPAKPAAAAAKPAASAGSATHAGSTAGSAGHPGATTTTANHAGATTTTTANHGATTTTTASHGATTTGAAGATHGPATTVGGAHTGGAAMAGGSKSSVGGAAHGGGGGPVANSHGSLSHPPAAGQRDHVGKDGSVMRTRSDGHPAEFHDAKRGMDVHHNLGGGRRVEVERRDGSRMSYERGRPGYISHGYNYHGHEYARRSYYYNGRAYDRYYNHYGYRGVYLDVYAPARYYGAGFYGWAYNPWAVPVAYAWGFGAAPWYGYYGAYFTPYPVYASPSLWLTDYLISQSLQASYEAHLAAAQQAAAESGSAPPAPLSPETKAMIAEEVKRQVALENAEATANAQHQEIEAGSSSIARILTDGQPHVFVAGKEVDVTDSGGQECAVTDGDVLQLRTPPPTDATTASLVVLSSKGGVECRAMATVTVSFEDLQDMQNHMRETIDTGLAELQTKQGKGGLPAAPASALVPATTAAVVEGAPAPDPPGGAQELMAQAQEADKAEQEVTASVAAGGPSDGAAPNVPLAPAPAAPTPTTVTVSMMGKSTDDVIAAMGQPVRITNLGPKVIYTYKDLKVTFKAGKVSDIE